MINMMQRDLTTIALFYLNFLDRPYKNIKMILHILNQTNIGNSILMIFRPSNSHKYTSSGITLCALSLFFN